MYLTVYIKRILLKTQKSSKKVIDDQEKEWYHKDTVEEESNHNTGLLLVKQARPRYDDERLNYHYRSRSIFIYMKLCFL